MDATLLLLSADYPAAAGGRRRRRLPVGPRVASPGPCSRPRASAAAVAPAARGLPHHASVAGQSSGAYTVGDFVTKREELQVVKPTTSVDEALEMPVEHNDWNLLEPPLPWRAAEVEILRDIDPVVQLIKDILHSDRYGDGECLCPKEENVVVEKLLAYHPRAQDKIGCGLDAVMVDRHPEFRKSRCLFVVRTDGVWIDFSYQKCLRAYIRQKYPSHAERFIREHFKRT